MDGNRANPGIFGQILLAPANKSAGAIDASAGSRWSWPPTSRGRRKQFGNVDKYVNVGFHYKCFLARQQYSQHYCMILSNAG
jgi:hypothetical protein